MTQLIDILQQSSRAMTQESLKLACLCSISKIKNQWPLEIYTILLKLLEDQDEDIRKKASSLLFPDKQYNSNYCLIQFFANIEQLAKKYPEQEFRNWIEELTTLYKEEMKSLERESIFYKEKENRYSEPCLVYNSLMKIKFSQQQSK